jgi:sugar lactone lactonase YvrE
MLANNIKISKVYEGLHAMAHATIGSAEVFGLHHAHAMTGEAPCWDARTGILWWIDIQGQRLLGHMPESGANLEYALPSMPGLVVCRRRGGLILGLEDGLYPFAPKNGLGMRLVAVEADDPRTRVNDGKPDAQGRLWFGTMDKTGAGTPIGSLYRLDLDGTLDKVRTDVRIPNAIDFSPDGSQFYFCDTRTHRIERFAYASANGTLGPATVFAAYPDTISPDGICIDREGGVWIALVDAAHLERRLPDGSLDTVVELPVSRPTMPMLGGSDGRTLFVVSQRRFLSTSQLARQPLAGDLLALRVRIPAKEACFASI